MVEIEYKLEGAGWASAILRPDDGQEIVLSDLSYLDEPLWDLLTLGLKCALRDPAHVLVFDNEGAFTRLSVEQFDICEPPDPMPVRIEVSSADWAERPEALVWRPKASFQTDSETFAAAVLACGEQVLLQHGIDGYDREWTSTGFPMRALLALRAALSVQDPVGAAFLYTVDDVETLGALSPKAAPS